MQATYRSTHMTHQAGMTRWTESERTEQRAQVCTGKERPRQNDARKNGTCQTRPGRLPRKRTLTVSMMEMVVLIALASGVRAC